MMNHTTQTPLLTDESAPLWVCLNCRKSGQALITETMVSPYSFMQAITAEHARKSPSCQGTLDDNFRAIRPSNWYVEMLKLKHFEESHEGVGGRATPS
jgi:hypothetical protein